MNAYTEIDIIITPHNVKVNGDLVDLNLSGKGILIDLYHKFVANYPKFFKMDTLSQLGFIGAEILFQQHPITSEDKEECAIIFGNTCASIKNDTDYLKTIESAENYYPSPSLFVYTLPNIVTGEIAIKQKIYGETCFYILKEENALFEIAKQQLNVNNIQTALVGWVECEEENNFYANIKLLWKN